MEPELASLKSFLVSTTEVSVAEYGEFLKGLGATRSPAKPIEPHFETPQPFSPFCSPEEHKEYPDGCLGHRPLQDGRDAWPRMAKNKNADTTAMRFVNWFDAAAYCAWKTKVSNGTLNFRLPTNDEWQKAARGCDGRPFPWGFHAGDVQQRVIDGPLVGTKSHPHLKSPYGLFHCSSSVAEWTADQEGRHRRRVMGTTWDLHTDRIHVGFSVGENAHHRSAFLGFRVAADVCP